MSLGEFDLIRHFFDRPELRSSRPDVLGIGDDCALLSVPEGMQLAQSLDTLVSGVHFPEHCDPFLLGYRALATNISDIAAMGAEPHSFTLGLTLPESDTDWLQAFSDGLVALAQPSGLALIGGDTTRGPLTISIQVQGLVPSGQALRRNGAKEGDLIYVSGSLGDAAGALPAVLEGLYPQNCEDASVQYLLQRYYQPSPRVKLGQWLAANGATSALDISDGLLGDLGHTLKASQVGAELNLEQLPLSPQLLNVAGKQKAQGYALSGGDDYELCFTWPAHKTLELPEEIRAECSVTCIGRITDAEGICDRATGQPLSAAAYRHF
ncbi:thiamine-phosphate kinase [Endozoicomonas gorgoniicola]|uniref:Thiamine-monophosphate kinase n=1 Tax=Endozoicomonas gorgoniicola TaxID=1234144 RepID=A0ABT3N2Y9_9GAMM|nr:thiamine-phosphate kinase [Endozoicomonas gorgoniicola]MCW7555997.1 thiamine-phosphate kinase [Endozoicomonas gorgoniicola]